MTSIADQLIGRIADAQAHQASGSVLVFPYDADDADLDRQAIDLINCLTNLVEVAATERDAVLDKAAGIVLHGLADGSTSVDRRPHALAAAILAMRSDASTPPDAGAVQR